MDFLHSGMSKALALCAARNTPRSQNKQHDQIEFRSDLLAITKQEIERQGTADFVDQLFEQVDKVLKLCRLQNAACEWRTSWTQWGPNSVRVCVHVTVWARPGTYTMEEQ